MALDPELKIVIEELEKEIYTPLKISPTMPSTRPRMAPTYISENESVRKDTSPPIEAIKGSVKFWIAVATVVYAWLTAYVFQKASYLNENLERVIGTRLERSWKEGELAGGEGMVVLIWAGINLVLIVLLCIYICSNIGRFNQFLDKHL